MAPVTQPRRSLALFLGLFALQTTGLGSASPEFDPKVPPEIPEQPLLRSIQVWGGEVVVLAEDYEPRTFTPYRVDLEHGSLEPLVIKGCSSIPSLAESASTQFAACHSPGKSRVLARNTSPSAKWRTELVLPEPTPEYLIAASGSAVAVVTSERIWYRADGGDWRKTDHKVRSEYLGVVTPTEVLLTRRSLYLGWDLGEWRGMLYRWPVLSDSESPFGTGEFLREINVNSIVEGPDGAVWVSAGLGHLGLRRGILLRIQGDDIRTLVNEDGYFDEMKAGVPEPELRLPGSSVIDGFTFDQSGRGLLLAESLGVLRLADGRLSYAIEGSLDREYRRREESIGQDVIIGSGPRGIVSTPEGIFAATSSLGVYAFFGAGPDYEFRQITVTSSR